MFCRRGIANWDVFLQTHVARNPRCNELRKTRNELIRNSYSDLEHLGRLFVLFLVQGGVFGDALDDNELLPRRQDLFDNV